MLKENQQISGRLAFSVENRFIRPIYAVSFEYGKRSAHHHMTNASGLLRRFVLLKKRFQRIHERFQVFCYRLVDYVDSDDVVSVNDSVSDSIQLMPRQE